MCGIIGYAGSENAVPIIVEGLQKLEYRGYDSAGLAVYTNGGFEVVKRRGRLSVLASEIEQNPISGNVGIGHTRWATHGEPSDVNAHPHIGSQSKIAVVHNGIIENHKQLKERLERKGISFASQTDSEVIAQIAEYYYNSAKISPASKRSESGGVPLSQQAASISPASLKSSFIRSCPSKLGRDPHSLDYKTAPRGSGGNTTTKGSETVPLGSGGNDRTDSELIEMVIKVTNRLEGSYALGIMCLDAPDTLIAIKKDNPLIVGISEHGHFIASDVPAVLKHTNQVYYLDDKEIAVLKKDTVQFFNIDREPIQKEPETITWSMDSAEKGGYQHFMLKEIMEQPKVLRETISSAINSGENKEIIDSIDIKNFNRIAITACGSAYNAGVVAKYVFEKLCGFPVEVDIASEFRYRDVSIDEKTLIILISQSGETADTIAALREAKAKNAVTLAIVNVVGSTIAKEADFCVYTAAGPEIAVATTKAFSAQLALLYVLAIRFSAKLGVSEPESEKRLLAELSSLPEKTESILAKTGYIQKCASACVGYKSIFFIGRNVDYAIALEGSLKLKEISYVHSEAYAGGELKHGPISLIEDNTLVVAISNCERLHSKIMSNVEQVISRGARVVLIGSCADTGGNDKMNHIVLPKGIDLFSPSLSVIVLQLFSYYVAANKGLDIDKPRNLAKSVTVE